MMSQMTYLVAGFVIASVIMIGAFVYKKHRRLGLTLACVGGAMLGIMLLALSS